MGGVVLVVRDIRDTRKHFDRPTIPTRIARWLGRFPFRKRAQIIAVGQAALTITSFGTAHVSTTAASSDLEARLQALEKNVGHLDTRITATEDRLRRELAAFREENAREQRGLREANVTLRRQVEELSAGGIDFKYMGVVWFVLGEAVTTFPAEVATWLAALHR
jgi:hypothetical protein